MAKCPNCKADLSMTALSKDKIKCNNCGFPLKESVTKSK